MIKTAGKKTVDSLVTLFNTVIKEVVVAQLVNTSNDVEHSTAEAKDWYLIILDDLCYCKVGVHSFTNLCSLSNPSTFYQLNAMKRLAELKKTEKEMQVAKVEKWLIDEIIQEGTNKL